MDGVAHAHKRHATIGEAWLEEYVAAYKLVQLWALGSQDNSMRNQRLPVVILERDVDVSLQRRTVSGRGGTTATTAAAAAELKTAATTQEAVEIQQLQQMSMRLHTSVARHTR